MGHWYSKDGKPMYTIVGKNGKERDTTLADARRLNLVPSVTTILDVENKPGLAVWKAAQVLQAAAEQPFLEGMNFDIWKRNVSSKAEESTKAAAKRGSEIHDSLELHYNGKKVKKDLEFINPVIAFMEEKFPNVQWVAEESFSHHLGFGGKVDLHSKTHNIVLDFKTKDTDDVKKMVPFSGHHMQTAAYAKGLGLPGTKDVKRYNLFISTKVPGLINLTESFDYDTDIGMFLCLLNFWKYKNNLYG